jgi:hypothetical protein
MVFGVEIKKQKISGQSKNKNVNESKKKEE